MVAKGYAGSDLKQVFRTGGQAFSAQHAISGTYYCICIRDDRVEDGRVGDTDVLAGIAGKTAAVGPDAEQAEPSDQLVEATEWAEFSAP